MMCAETLLFLLLTLFLLHLILIRDEQEYASERVLEANVRAWHSHDDHRIAVARHKTIKQRLEEQAQNAERELGEWMAAHRTDGPRTPARWVRERSTPWAPRPPTRQIAHAPQGPPPKPRDV